MLRLFIFTVIWNNGFEWVTCKKCYYRTFHIFAEDNDEEKEKKAAQNLWKAFKARKEKRQNSKEDSEDSGRQDSVLTESSDVDRLLSPNDAIIRMENESETFDDELEPNPSFESENGVNDDEPVYEYEEGAYAPEEINQTLEEIEEYEEDVEQYQGRTDEYPPFESALENMLVADDANNEGYDDQQNLSDIVEEADDNYEQDYAVQQYAEEGNDYQGEQRYDDDYYEDEQHGEVTYPVAAKPEEYDYDDEYDDDGNRHDPWYVLVLS